ncbi:cation:proton antiporter [Rhodobacteraceae bacterium 63075]|nr:cation:proton antiporter [Rhodobacteraceae bacterium 63075]
MDLAGFLTTLGVLFLAGLAADELGRVTKLPRVTLLLLLGMLAGNAGFDLIPLEVTEWFDELSSIALTMVAFLLGGALSRKTLRKHGRAILTISLAIVVFTILLVTLGLIAAGVAPGLAIILGAVATATAPAAMTDVIHQSGIKNKFTKTLNGIVAIDDAWGLIVFSIALVLVGQSDTWAEVVGGAAWDLGGAIVLGCVIGFPAAYLSGRLKPGEPLQAEAMGIVFLCCGLALRLEVSFLIAGMTVGIIVANFARHHSRAFHEIEHVQWPFMILFFLLAGALLDPEALLLLGWAGILFLVLRVVGRIIGGYVGARLGHVPQAHVKWYGPALLPQAGIAVGMALVASEAFPEWAASIMAFTIASTVVFEIIGPPLTMHAIRRVEALKAAKAP